MIFYSAPLKKILIIPVIQVRERHNILRLFQTINLSWSQAYAQIYSIFTW